MNSLIVVFAFVFETMSDYVFEIVYLRLCYIFSKQTQRETSGKIDDVQEKLSIATATLQQAIGGINSQMATYTEKVHTQCTPNTS